MTNRKTGILTHEHYFWHNTGHAAGFIPAGLTVQPDTHAENAETKRRMLNLLDVSGLLDQLVRMKPRVATDAEILRHHTPEYFNRIREMSENGGGDAGELTPFGPGGFDIAALSAGGCLAAVEALMAGDIDNGYVLNRPPGHHAEADQGRGFCIFANAALTAMHAIETLGVERVAIVDWDVHHGNSQEKAFYNRSDVLTISMHQDNFYPVDSGHLVNNGEGEGAGANLNVPLPPGSGHGAYTTALEQIVTPALRRFKPQLILICSGFDASFLDPLGRNMCYTETYRSMTASLMALADELCQGRLLALHEGGYSTAYVPYCGLAVMETLSGIRTEIQDPFIGMAEPMAGQDLQPHQTVLIDAVSQYLGNIPEN